jgi:hypothetical protein
LVEHAQVVEQRAYGCLVGDVDERVPKPTLGRVECAAVCEWPPPRYDDRRPRVHYGLCDAEAHTARAADHQYALLLQSQAVVRFHDD